MLTVSAAGRYVSWGVIDISVTNLVIILLMVAIFALALVLPFPRERGAHRVGNPEARDRGGVS